MARTHLTAAIVAAIAGLEVDAAAALQTKLDEHDTALDSLGAATSVGSEALDGTTGKIIADVAKRFSLLTVSGTKAFTLPDGTVTGQVHTFRCVSASATPVGTLTITTPLAGTSSTYVFHAAAQEATFLWDGTAWGLISKKRAGALTVVVGTTVLTGYLLTAIYNLSVTGTVVSGTTKGIPDGEFYGDVAELRCTVAAGTPHGDVTINAQLPAGTAYTHFSDITATTFYAVMQWSTKWMLMATTGGTPA